MYKISEIVDLSIFFKADFITTLISNLYTFPYSSTVKTMYITYLHFIKN